MAFNDVLAKQAPTGTIWYDLDDIYLGSNRSPSLEMRPAGEKNEPYWSALCKLISARRGTAGSLTPRSIREDREEDADLFARFVVKDWKNVYEDGKPAPCTPEKVKEMLVALIEHRPDVFVRITARARNMNNFVDGDALASGAELGKP